MNADVFQIKRLTYQHIKNLIFMVFSLLINILLITLMKEDLITFVPKVC